MTPLEEKIAERLGEIIPLEYGNVLMEDDTLDKLIGFVQSIATQAVEEYKKELLDIEFRAPADKSDDWHAGIRYCIEKFRNIISKPNI